MANGGGRYVEMLMVQPGTCLTSATVTALYYGGTTSMIPGVGVGDAISVFGNVLSLIADGPVGVIGEIAQGMPIVNTGYLTGSAITAELVTKSISSPAGTVSASAAVAIGLDDAGTLPQSVSNGTFSSELNLTVVRPPLPALSVDDTELNFIGGCGAFQTTRLRAMAGGVDVARLLSFQTTDDAVATINARGPYPLVVAHGAGATQLDTRDASTRGTFLFSLLSGGYSTGSLTCQLALAA